MKFCLIYIKNNWLHQTGFIKFGFSYFGFGSGSGSFRALPTGFFSASSAVTRWNSASTLPWWIQSNIPSVNQSATLCLYTVCTIQVSTVSVRESEHRHRQLSRFVERPPASGSLLLEDGYPLWNVHHVGLTGLCRLCPTRETVEV